MNFFGRAPPTSSSVLLDFILQFVQEALNNCVMCDRGKESAPSSFFFHCEVVSKVWLEFNFITPPTLFVHLDCWSKEGRTKKSLENSFE